MVDLIDRQDLLKNLNRFAPEKYDALVNDIRKKQPTIEVKPHWIPCSERLPEGGQKCLVCDKGSIGIDTYIGHGNPYNWKWYTRDYEAWMPLPDPYKGGEN